jgi:protein-S-isoprenylcysteine O-methyltransferase Ste14
MLTCNWLAATYFLLVTSRFLYHRISKEEEMMLQTFGAEYESYRRRTKRLIPWIY